MRSRRVSPMPIRMPLVNGTAASPAARDRLEAHRRVLVGRAEMRRRRGARSRSAALSSMMPCDTETGRSRSMSARRHDPWVQMRQEPGLAQHQLRHLGEIGQRRRVAEPRQRVARRAIAQLGLVAQV